MRIADCSTLLAVVMLAGCGTITRGLPPVNGLANFDYVDERVVRSAQPSRLNLQWLRDCEEVRTVIDLTDAENDEELYCRELGLTYYKLRWSGVTAPQPGQIDHALFLMQTEPGKVLVHCQWGCERTGVAVACYRISVNHWTTKQALEEAEAHALSPLAFGFRAAIERHRP